MNNKNTEEFYQFPIKGICINKPLGEMIDEASEVTYTRKGENFKIRFIYEGNIYTLAYSEFKPIERSLQDVQ